MFLANKGDLQDQGKGITSILENVNTALWEFDVHSKRLKCSAGFYSILGYDSREREMTYSYFINDILYHEDIPLLFKEANSCTPGRSKTLEIRLLTKQGFQWFQNSFRREESGSLTGSIVNIHQFKVLEFKLAAKNTRYAAVAKIVRSGSWEVDIKSGSLSVSKEAGEILCLPLNQKFETIDLIQLFIPGHRPILTSSINSAIEIGKPFDHDLQLRTATNELIWVKIKGLTTIDELGEGITLKGIVQNIDQSKRKETALQASFEFLEHQNKRLQTFAYMVSHNLRSHANNLQYLVGMHEETNDPDERKEVFDHISTISNSLNTTIQHLNEIVKIEADIRQEKVLISIEAVFRNVLNALENNIEQAEAVIEFDFTACPTVNYIPAYLESIFHNFLTNSLKYRHLDRRPLITCHSELNEGNTYLIFKDNGIGIDMARYGNKVFGMYQTFHKHSDSQGIGLFITRNQVEALGGKIEVSSEVGVGTTFTVYLGSAIENSIGQ